MKYSILLVIFSTSVMLTACSLKKGIVQFEKQNNEIIVSNKIKEFIKTTQTPSIVLRTPITEQGVTQSDPNSYIYNAIEKELILAGFNVKDRGLFNEIISNSSSYDYSELKALTETELILELVRVETKVRHQTNRFYDVNGNERQAKNVPIVRLGAAIEFKLIIIENNIYGGNYSFYYTPCTKDVSTKDCLCTVGYKDFPDNIYPYVNKCNETSNFYSYEIIEQNVIENFIREGVKQMIKEIRK